MPSRTKLAPKKQRQQFVAKVAALLIDLGAEPGDFDFTLRTKAGVLKLHPTENQVDGLGTLFSRFDDPAAARDFGVCCNPFSGKWNFHFFSGWDIESALNELAYQLAKVLP